MRGIAENTQGLKVLIAGSVLQAFLGIIYVWSVFVMPVSEFYQWNPARVKLMTAYMLCAFVVGILIGGKFQERTGAAKAALTGGMMFSAGTLATAFIPVKAAWLMYVSYGIIGGFGVGIAYNANISAAQKWFPRNRGFAAGVSVCAFGFSTVIFAPLVESLISRFGLQTTFILLSAAFFAAVLALFSYIRFPESADKGAAPALPPARMQYTTARMLARKEFYFITLSLMFATATFFILNPSFKTLAAERGLDPEIGTAIVMMTGLANALGRLGIPLLSDAIGRESSALLIIVITALCAVGLIFAQGFAFMAMIALIAFCYGGSSGVYPVLTADYFGLKNIGSNYGAVMVGFAVSALVFPILVSAVEDSTLKFAALAVLAVLGALLIMLLMLAKRTFPT